MKEKRASNRKNITITTIVKKLLSDATCQIMEFLSANLSHSGIFILAEDLSLFDLGEELTILVDSKGDRCYEGKARVVRSARFFSPAGNKNASGYGLMFLEPDDEFKQVLLDKLK